MKSICLRKTSPRRPFSLPWFGILAWAIMAASCAVGPDFKKPDMPMPDKWTGVVLKEAAAPGEAELSRWWTIFNDPLLSSLIDRAAASNLDVQLAEARLRQARAAYGIAAAAAGPDVDVTASIRRSRSASGGKELVTVNQFQAGFDASWEADIFGGVRRSMEAAEADIAALVEERRDTLVTLFAEIARNYIDLRAFQERISLARRNLEAQRHSTRLTRQRFEGGFAGRLDVTNAEAQEATTASQIPLLEAAARQVIYNLGILVGREPASLLEELSATAKIPSVPPSIPPGLPSDLLRRRPDIRRAEAKIHAATARIGVATADLFPRFRISGAVGVQAGELTNLADPLSQFWSLGPSLIWSVFSMGRNQSAIEVQKILQEQSLITYRQTVLAALQEVENALIASAKEEEHGTALSSAVMANRRAVDLAVMLYTEGQTDFLNVLNAQRSLYASEDALVQSNRTVSANLVALYKALGGGWDAPRAVGATDFRQVGIMLTKP